MEVTALYIRLMMNVLLLFTAQPQNCHYVHKADAAFLHIDPNRLQFFEYEPISLHCVGFQGLTEWRVMRNFPSNATSWETSAGRLDIKPAYVSHSGEYWCENGDGERSNTVNITVTAGEVILESPTLPVMEKQDVILRCRTTDKSNLAADFIRDGLHLDGFTGFTGELTIRNVSKSHEGRYKCKIFQVGVSPESWLTVTEYFPPGLQKTTPHEAQKTPRHPPYSGPNQRSILLTVVLIILCVAALLLVLGILQHQKHKVYEHAVADPQIAIYASVKKPKKNRVCRGENAMADTSDVTYATVTAKKKKKRVPAEANVPDPDKSTYAVVALQRKERGH